MGFAEQQETVMLVDDTPANLRLLEDLLRSHGYRVMSFPGGSTALRGVARHKPDLILLDIMMAEMDGFEVCRRLKAEASSAEIPVIFMSALDDTESKVRAFAEGGVDYVTKPFQDEEILARVRTHITLRRMRRELERHNLFLEDLVREKMLEVGNLQLTTIHAMTRLAEYRDEDTGQHIERTQVFCRRLAEKLRENPRFAGTIDEKFLEDIYHASSLHDIGKVGIPDAVLLKPGRLTPEEFEIIKQHVEIGAMALRWVNEEYPHNSFIQMGMELTRFHHERWDGGGYPDGLAGEAIPLSARIMALVDVYDALRSRRPYKESFTRERSREIVSEGAGTHFDPVIVEAFLAIEPDFAAIFDRMQDDRVFSFGGR